MFVYLVARAHDPLLLCEKCIGEISDAEHVEFFRIDHNVGIVFDSGRLDLICVIEDLGQARTTRPEANTCTAFRKGRSR